jgi:hypothetical protein
LIGVDLREFRGMDAVGVEFGYLSCSWQEMECAAPSVDSHKFRVVMTGLLQGRDIMGASQS